MPKLFSIESDTTNPNDMLIDKILQSRQKSKEGLSLTAELLQQRHELKTEITQALNKTPESEDKDKEDTGKTDDKKEEIDSEEASQSEEGLEGLIGSGLSKSDKQDKTVAKESYKEPKMTLSNLFAGLKSKHQDYRRSVQMFSLESDALSVTHQPVVYVKDEVVKAVNTLISIAQQSVSKNAQRIELAKTAAKSIGDRLAVYHACVEKELLSFTNQVVYDTDMLCVVSTKDKSNVADNAKILNEFLQSSSSTAMMVAKAPIEQLRDVFTSANYTSQGTDLIYPKQLPGFYQVTAGLTNYPNYIDVRYQDYQVYRAKTLKPLELQSLSGYRLTQDKELDSLLSVCDKLLAGLGLAVDDLNAVNDTYLKLIDKLKSVAYDIEKDTTTDLASIGLDEHMKDFIRFRMMTDLYTLNIDLCSEFMSGVLSVLGVVSDLRSAVKAE